MDSIRRLLRRHRRSEGRCRTTIEADLRVVACAGGASRLRTPDRIAGVELQAGRSAGLNLPRHLERRIAAQVDNAAMDERMRCRVAGGDLANAAVAEYRRDIDNDGLG